MASLEWVTVSTSRQSSAAQPCPTDKQDRFLQTVQNHVRPIKTSGKPGSVADPENPPMEYHDSRSEVYYEKTHNSWRRKVVGP